MECSIDAHIEFSFKGEDYASSFCIDLDRFMEGDGAQPAIHAILAERMGIDTTSYLYEVMLESEIRFDQARGLAADFLCDGKFDFAGFMAQWRESRVLSRLCLIAERHLGVDGLDGHPGLKRALMEAYRLGEST